MITVATLRAAGLSAGQIVAEANRAAEAKCFVYCLVDPKTRLTFYVGVSKYPFHRFQEHRADPASCAYDTVNRLLQTGYHPNQIYKIFKECADRQSALDLEYNLINSTPGLLNRNRLHQTVYA